MVEKCSNCRGNPATGYVLIDKWSGMGSDMEFPYCSERCRLEIMSAAERVRRGAPWFLWGLVVWLMLALGLIVASIVSSSRELMVLSPPLIVFIGGGLLVAFPLVASNAVPMLGIRAAERFARQTGAVMMMAGVGFYLLLTHIFMG